MNVCSILFGFYVLLLLKLPQNETSRRMLIDPILMTVARKVGVFLLPAPSCSEGDAECLEGKLLCRGKRYYSVAAVQHGTSPPPPITPPPPANSFHPSIPPSPPATFPPPSLSPQKLNSIRIYAKLIVGRTCLWRYQGA